MRSVLPRRSPRLRFLALSSAALAAASASVGCDRRAPPSPDAPTARLASDATAHAPAAAAGPSASGSASAVPAGSTPPSAAHAAVKLPKDLNVVLITIDSLRADMPWAGYPREIAPHLTALEKRAVSYTNAYALSSYTSMSVGGFLAGDYPGAVKRDGYFFGTYPKDVLMFPERLSAAGVRTVAVQAHGYFKVGTGLSQGFDVWKIIPNLKWNAQTDENVTSPKHEALAEEVLSDPANVGGRFFAWFHFMDPHDQYMPHKEGTAWGKKTRDLYDGEVEYTDTHVGKLLAFIEKQPWAPRTVIVVSADHGESFGEHGVHRHGFEIFQNLVRVPWFFVVPGVTGRRIEAPRSHLDLAPTILDLMGVKADPPLRGDSLVPELLGEVQPGVHDIITDLPRTSDNDRRRALITGKYKIIAYSDDAYFRIYDIEADPDETKDLLKTDKELSRSLIEKYKAAVAGIKDVKPYACKELKGTPEKPLPGGIASRRNRPRPRPPPAERAGLPRPATPSRSMRPASPRDRRSASSAR
jgi:choline-sulfatase